MALILAGGRVVAWPQHDVRAADRERGIVRLARQMRCDMLMLAVFSGRERCARQAGGVGLSRSDLVASVAARLQRGTSARVRVLAPAPVGATGEPAAKVGHVE